MIVVFLYTVSFLSYAYEFALFNYFKMKLVSLGIAWGCALISAAITKMYLTTYRTRFVVAFQTACLTLAGAAVLRHWSNLHEMAFMSMMLGGVTIGTLSLMKITPGQLITAVGLGGVLADMGVLGGGEIGQAGPNLMYKGGIMVPQDLTLLLAVGLFMLAPWVINPDEILVRTESGLPKTIPKMEREHWVVSGTRIVSYRLLQNLWLVQFPIMEPYICGPGWGLLITFAVLCRLFGQYSMVPEHVEQVRLGGWFSSILFVFIAAAKPGEHLLACLAGLAQIIMCTSFIRQREQTKNNWHDLVAGVITALIFASGDIKFVTGAIPLAFALSYKYK